MRRAFHATASFSCKYVKLCDDVAAYGDEAPMSKGSPETARASVNRLRSGGPLSLLSRWQNSRNLVNWLKWNVSPACVSIYICHASVIALPYVSCATPSPLCSREPDAAVPIFHAYIFILFLFFDKKRYCEKSRTIDSADLVSEFSGSSTVTGVRFFSTSFLFFSIGVMFFKNQ